MQEMQVQSMDREDPLEGEMATYTSILVWGIPGTEEPGRVVIGITTSWLQQCACMHSVYITSCNSIKNIN